MFLKMSSKTPSIPIHRSFLTEILKKGSPLPTCHVSRFMCHMPNVFFLQSDEAIRWRVCYQQDLPRLIFIQSWNSLQAFYYFSIYKNTLTFQKVPCFTVKSVVWIILNLTQTFVLSMQGFSSTNIWQTSSGSA